MEKIESTENKRVKHVIKLRDKGRARREEGLFIAEGKRWLYDAAFSDISELYVSESFAKENEGTGPTDDYERSGKGEAFIVTDAVMKKMSGTETPQGVLAVLKMPAFSFEELIKKQNPLLLFLENIQDPGNLGTVMRTAEGAGVTGVIMSRDTTDIYSPKAVRSTMGSLLRVPHVIAEDFNGTIEDAKAAGIRMYAALPDSKKRYDECDYRASSAFIIGNEANGIKDETAKLADTPVGIPMGGKLESLNAAMAAGILMYEAARKRNFSGGTETI